MREPKFKLGQLVTSSHSLEVGRLVIDEKLGYFEPAVIRRIHEIVLSQSEDGERISYGLRLIGDTGPFTVYVTESELAPVETLISMIKEQRDNVSNSPGQIEFINPKSTRH